MEDGARAARFTMHGAQLGGSIFVLLVIFNALLSSGAESSASR